MTDDELSQWLLRNAGPGVGREAQRKINSIWWGPATERRRRLETWRDYVLSVTPGLTCP